MATLHDRDGKVSLSLTPIRLGEGNQPKWVDALLVLETHGKKRLEDTVSLTVEDLEDLHRRVSEFSIGRLEEVEWQSEEEELCLHLYFDRERRVDQPILECWYGEPFGLMVGHRFIVDIKEVINFSGGIKGGVESLKKRTPP